MEKKLGCPFCGSIPFIESFDTAYGSMYTITCSNPKCDAKPSIDGPLDGSRNGIIRLWNTRHLATTSKYNKRIVRLEKAILNALGTRTLGDAERALHSAM